MAIGHIIEHPLCDLVGDRILECTVNTSFVFITVIKKNMPFLKFQKDTCQFMIFIHKKIGLAHLGTNDLEFKSNCFRLRLSAHILFFIFDQVTFLSVE